MHNGQQIPIPGGPGDPDGDFDAIYQDVLHQPGTDPVLGSSYIQAVTWDRGSACPNAAMLLTYSESTNPNSPHIAEAVHGSAPADTSAQVATAAAAPATVASRNHLDVSMDLGMLIRIGILHSMN